MPAEKGNALEKHQLSIKCYDKLLQVCTSFFPYRILKKSLLLLSLFCGLCSIKKQSGSETTLNMILFNLKLLVCEK